MTSSFVSLRFVGSVVSMSYHELDAVAVVAGSHSRSSFDAVDL